MIQSGFTRKKVESLTLGEKLKKLRGDFRMSLVEISKVTKIQVKYLEFLENGEYNKLPADVYVRGFLRSYARYLNIDEQAFIKLYERERHIQANLSKETVKKTFNVKNLSISSLVITPRSLVIVAICFLVGGAFFYIFREFQSFAGVPRLVILSPMNGSTVEANEVVVQGKTDKGARVSINNQSVFVGSDGDFSDKIILQGGLNTMTIVAVNRFDKEKSETISVEAKYAPSVTEKSGEETMIGNIATTFRIEVFVHPAPTKVTLEADGSIVFSGILKAGEVQSLSAKTNIKILTEDETQTFIRMNGGNEEPLGTEKKGKSSIVFTATGRQQ
ncbi:MAG: helix-turn-helix domain-containing protein [Candidatus Moraniibacteriota bacterium]